MEQLFRANDTRKFYEKVNRSRKGYVPRVDMCRDVEANLLTEESGVINRWRQYFNEHLNGDEVNRGIRVELGEPAADNTFPTPELQEVQQKIRKLKNNRAAGKDRLPGEFFKYEGKKLARGLYWVISKI